MGHSLNDRKDETRASAAQRIAVPIRRCYEVVRGHHSRSRTKERGVQPKGKVKTGDLE
jgi:hypothetical protein